MRLSEVISGVLLMLLTSWKKSGFSSSDSSSISSLTSDACI